MRRSEIASDSNQFEAGLGNSIAQSVVIEFGVGDNGGLRGCAGVEDDLDVQDAGDLTQFFGDRCDAVSAGHSVDGEFDGAVNFLCHDGAFLWWWEKWRDVTVRA